MTEEEFKSKQEETLNRLNKFNEDRKTEIVDDPNDPDNFDGPEPEWFDVDIEIVDDNDFYEEDEPIENILDAFERGEKGVTVPPMQEWLDESDRLNKERGVTISPPPICQFCANFVYQGQLHGPGYCKEKVQYEQ